MRYRIQQTLKKLRLSLILLMLFSWSCTNECFKINDQFAVIWTPSCNCYAMREYFDGEYNVMFMKHIKSVKGNSDSFIVESSPPNSNYRHYTYIQGKIKNRSELISLDNLELELLLDTLDIRFYQEF